MVPKMFEPLKFDCTWLGFRHSLQVRISVSSAICSPSEKGSEKKRICSPWVYSKGKICYQGSKLFPFRVDSFSLPHEQIISIQKKTCRPRWLSRMRRPTGDQEVAGSTPAEVGNILSWRLIMKYFRRPFSHFR